MIRKIIAAAGLLLMLASCATMSEEDCLTANWRSIGANDGSDGAAYSRLSNRVEQCREHGVEANITEYNAGYERGLVSYCTPANGFRVGSNGSSYNGVCPIEAEGQFLAAYNEGRELYRLRNELRYAENALQNLYSRIDDCQDDIEKLRRNQKKEETKLPQEEYEARLDNLYDDIRKLERQIPDRRYDLDIARAALAAFTYRRW